MCMRPPSHVQHTTPTRTYWREASFVVLLGSRDMAPPPPLPGAKGKQHPKTHPPTHTITRLPTLEPHLLARGVAHGVVPAPLHRHPQVLQLAHPAGGAIGLAALQRRLREEGRGGIFNTQLQLAHPPGGYVSLAALHPEVQERGRGRKG